MQDLHFLRNREYIKKLIIEYHDTQLISSELASTTENRIEEVVLLFGSSFTNPRDVFRLRIPTLDYSHSTSCNGNAPNKNWRNLFRYDL